MGARCCRRVKRYDFKVAASPEVGNGTSVDFIPSKSNLNLNNQPITSPVQNGIRTSENSSKSNTSSDLTVVTSNMTDSDNMAATELQQRLSSDSKTSDSTTIKDISCDLLSDNASCDTISEVSSDSVIGSEVLSIIYDSIPERLPVSRGSSESQGENCLSVVNGQDEECDSLNSSNDSIPSLRKLQRSTPGRIGRPYQASRLGRYLSRSTSQDTREIINWQKGSKIGRGTFGTVYQGLTSTGELIAVKQVELIETDYEEAEKEYSKIYQEVSLLKSLNHKNIVGYLGSNYENSIISIFMEYIAGGSIFSILEKFGPLNEAIVRRYTQQLLDAVAFLHYNNVVHRDIKSANIMLVPSGSVKLIDFGCAKRLALRLSRSGSHLQMSLRGTPYWMAPEVINETGHGKKSDIWSLGCTVFEMFTGKPPWGDREPFAAIYAIGSEEFAVPTLPEDTFSPQIREFVQLFLIRDKRKRPNARDLLKHPFITSPDTASTYSSTNL